MLNGRLALFRHGPGQSEYWRKYWTDRGNEERMIDGGGDQLPEVDVLIERWAGRNLPVLEAGCGPGHVVAALKSRGYTAIGVELEPEIVARVHAGHPDLDVRLGDVRKLDFADGSLGCYLSLGVVEHFVEGPVEVLREARRVLSKEGIALISVPYLNPLRRLQLQHVSGPSEDEAEFHQYYFGEEEFTRMLEAVGFEVVESLPYAAEAFLSREHSIFARFWESPLSRSRVRREVRRVLRSAPRWARERYSHMIMFVCRPVQ
jgi:SAM-dependent methyltransferase